jgi:aspartate beta-hydroxylase
MAELTSVRRACNALIDAWRQAGNEEAARAVAEQAVAQGVWQRWNQRPIHYVPRLAALPVHDPAAFYVVRYLESHADTIAAEVLGSVGDEGAGLLPVEEPLVASGAWELAMFHEGGMRYDATCRRFPRTAAILDDAPEEIRQAGVVMLSWLKPGTYIVPHCGFSNARLRIHLPLRPAQEATMRVGDRTLTWQYGRCLVFDDSFEHEVRHEGDKPRLVLLLDIFHPALSAAERADFRDRHGVDPQRKAAEAAERIGLRAVELLDDERLAVRMAPEQDRRMRRYLRESGLRALDLDSPAANRSWDAR